MEASYIRAVYWTGQVLALTAVAGAKRKGILPDPKTLSCEDCGKVAREYDHRDYGKPLRVAPVCHSCNSRRGKAVPRQWTDAELLAYARRMLVKSTAWKNHATFVTLHDSWDRSEWHVGQWEALRRKALVLVESLDNRFTVLDLAPELFHAVEEKAA